MPNFADLKARSRAKLHEALSYPAVFYASVDADPKLIRVRKHITNPMLQGDLKGTNLSYAEIQDNPTSLVFVQSDVPDMARNSIVLFDETEVYVVDNVHPPYNLTVKAEVRPVKRETYSTLLTPGDF